MRQSVPPSTVPPVPHHQNLFQIPPSSEILPDNTFSLPPVAYPTYREARHSYPQHYAPVTSVSLIACDLCRPGVEDVLRRMTVPHQLIVHRPLSSGPLPHTHVARYTPLPMHHRR